MEKKFSIEESFSVAWKILKKNFWFILALQIIVLVVNFFPEVLNGIFEDNSNMDVILLMVGVGFFILQLIINIGMIKIFLGLHDGRERISPSELFSGVDYFFRYILASLVYALIVLIGFILLIVPGIIWSIKYQFFAYLVIDKNMRAMEAIRASAQITKGHKWHLFLFSCAAILVNIGGFLALGVGILVTMPLTSLAIVSIFRKLSADLQIGNDIVPGEEKQVIEAPEAQA